MTGGKRRRGRIGFLAGVGKAKWGFWVEEKKRFRQN
jgi:hypothetical protein